MAGTINKPKKPKSKRTPVRLRHKIEKASAAKQRKDRKLAKKNPEWRTKLKKDPGIPNLFPYKERLLHKIEQDRLRKQEDAQRRREAAKAARTGTEQQINTPQDDEEVMSGVEDSEDHGMEEGDGVDESNPMAALLASARKAAEDYDNKLESGDDLDEDDEHAEDSAEENEDGSTRISDGATSRRAFDKVFREVVEQADVVLYVLDARDPEGTRSRDVEQSVMASAASGKRLILILNKIDLVPPPVLHDWLIHLRRSFPTLPLRAAGAAPNAHTFNHRDMTVQSTSSALFRGLKSYAASRKLMRAISVGVIGYPNVGKSSIINALLSRLGGGRSQHSACPTGAEAGVTTAIRRVKIDNKLTLLDSPGIVFPSTSSPSHVFVPKNQAEAHAHLVLLNAVPPKHIDDPVPAVTLLLKRLSTTPDLMEKLTALYELPPLLPGGESGDVTTDFLVHVARKRGRLGRGGVPNIASAAMTVVTDWRDGRIQGWVDAPVLPVTTDVEMSGKPSIPQTDSATAGPDQKQIVTEWAQEFKLEGLWGDDDVAGKETEMQE